MAGRQDRILEYVTENRRVDVTDLAAMMAVSAVTIRKDLDRLERNGLLRREHGYAVAAHEDNMVSRLAYHHELKRSIAQQVAATVPDGETVMIESGSTCALLAAELGRSHRGITIITNSAFIADFTRRNTTARVVLLGGDYQSESQVCVGPLTAMAASGFFVNRLFVGVDGYTEDSGFTAKNHLRAEAVRAMAQQAEEMVVVTESIKFPRQGAVRLVPAASVSTLYTDDRLPASIQSQLAHHGVRVIKVPADVPQSTH
ncbi:MAG: DeoR/GlpR family DNA-binding transcription regulator [Propioniciclava sp.]